MGKEIIFLKMQEFLKNTKKTMEIIALLAHFSLNSLLDYDECTRY